jgi:hypothetical protein
MEYEQKLNEYNAAKYGLLEQRYRPSQTTAAAFGPDPAMGVLGVTPQSLVAPTTQATGPYNVPLTQQQQQQQPGLYGPEFYARAAAIPGYQSLANTMASQEGALQRQMQEQGWSANNMSKYQAAQVTNQQLQLEEQKRHAMAQEGISGGHLGLAQKEFGAKYMPDPNNPGGYIPRPQPPELEKNHIWAQDPVTGQKIQAPAPGTTKWREEQGQADTIDAGISGAGALAKHFEDYGAFTPNRAAAKSAEVQRQKVITAMGVLSNMGVLQPGDLDRLTKQLTDPTDVYGAAFTNEAGAIAAVKEVKARLNEALGNKYRSVPTLRRSSSEVGK